MTKHAAREISLKSQEYVHSHNREGWLGMYAEDGIIQDPIGPSYIDPDGKGFSTPEERAFFYDNFIANSDINVEIVESFSVGNECANRLKLTIKFEHEGQKMKQHIDGIFTYVADDQGKLKSLRGYWEQDASPFEPI